MKLTSKDIKFISEGKQLKEYILKKYTMKEYLTLTQYTPSTLERYLNSRTIKNNKRIGKKFIRDTEKIFKNKLENIIHTAEDQFNDYCLDILNDIDAYNDLTDINTFMTLENKSFSIYNQLLIKIITARYRYNLGSYQEAFIMLKNVIKILERKKIIDLILLTTGELGYLHILKGTIKSGINCFEYVLNKYSLDTLSINSRTKYYFYIFYYRYAYCLRHNNQLDKARATLEKALLYANRNQIYAVYNNDALTYISEHRLEVAEQKYQIALKSCCNKSSRLLIYNNLAYLYVEKGNIEKAQKYINYVINNMDKSMPLCKRLNYFDSYIQINNYNKHKIKIYYALELLRDIDKAFGNETYISSFLNSILKYCTINKDMNFLNQMVQLLNKKIINTNDEIKRLRLKNLAYNMYKEIMKGV